MNISRSAVRPMMSLCHQKKVMAVAKPLLATNYNNQNFTLGRMKLQLKS